MNGKCEKLAIARAQLDSPLTLLIVQYNFISLIILTNLSLASFSAVHLSKDFIPSADGFCFRSTSTRFLPDKLSYTPIPELVEQILTAPFRFRAMIKCNEFPFTRIHRTPLPSAHPHYLHHNSLLQLGGVGSSRASARAQQNKMVCCTLHNSTTAGTRATRNEESEKLSLTPVGQPFLLTSGRREFVI